MITTMATTMADITKTLDHYFKNTKNLKLISRTDIDGNYGIKFQISKLVNKSEQIINVTFNITSLKGFSAEAIGNKVMTQNINSYILENDRMTLSTFLDYISKNNLDDELMIDHDSDDDFSEFNESVATETKESIIIDTSNKDIEFVKMKRLWEQKYIDGSNNGTDIDHNKDTARIVINELLDIIRIEQQLGIRVTPIDNNIYHLNIRIAQFDNTDLFNKLKEVNSKFGYDYIEFNIEINQKLYPFYPPTINFMRPRLSTDVMYKLSNLKMVQLKYWSPSRDLKYILTHMKKILNKWAMIDQNSTMNSIQNFPEGSYLPLEKLLLGLSSIGEVNTDSVDTLDDTDYIAVNLSNEAVEEKKETVTVKPKKIHKYYAKSKVVPPVKSGIGYGTDGSSQWDIDSYVRAQKEKMDKIQKYLSGICDALTINYDNEENCMMYYQIIRNSHLMPFIYQYLSGVTLLEIKKNEELYMTIFQILLKLCSDKMVDLFTNFELLRTLEKEAKFIMAKMGDSADNNNLNEIIIEICDKMTPFIKTSKDKNTDKVNKDKNGNQQEKEYTKKMEALKYDDFDILENKTFHYIKDVQTVRHTKQSIERIMSEISAFSSSLPIYYSSSIFIRSDTNNMSVMQAMITGPKDTPYSNGCYFFDIFIPNNYPYVAPVVYYKTPVKTAHGEDPRFNPNLYNNGKVCLSLLGTWSGDKSESWNPQNSTILQILISIQSLILVEDPYYNEPSYERDRGTDKGNHSATNYANNAKYLNMKWAIHDIIKNPRAGFENIIKEHFSMKKNDILEECKKWVTVCTEWLDNSSKGKVKPAYTKADLEKAYNDIVVSLQ